MAMVVRTNYSALNATRHLNKNQSGVAGSIEKLSSGFRVNRAADDAAGLAISEKMKAQIKALDVAVANAEDGIGLIQTTEGYLDSIHGMLNRMVELAEKSANGIMQTGQLDDVYGANVGDVRGGIHDEVGRLRGINQTAETDRDALQAEMNQLCAEIDRVAATANFNKVKLFTGNLATNQYDRIRNEGQYRNSTDAIASVGRLIDEALKADEAGADTIRTARDTMTDAFIDVNQAQTDLDHMKGDVLVLRAVQTALEKKIAANDMGGVSNQIGGSSYFGAQAEIDRFIKDLSLVTGNGTAITTAAEFDAYFSAATPFGTHTLDPLTDPDNDHDQTWNILLQFSIGDTLTAWNGFVDDAQVVLNDALDVAKPLEAAYYQAIEDLYNEVAGRVGLKVEFDRATGDNTQYVTSFSVDMAKLDTYRDWANPAHVGGKVYGEGLTLQIGETSNAADKLTVSVARMHTDSIFANLTDPNTWKNSDGNNDVRIDINSASTVQGVIGYTIDISGQQRASAAAEALNSVINMVSMQRAELGAMQNRLDYTIDNLNTASENMQAANSRIRDTDMAKEMTKFTMQNVLLQAAQSMLSQANAQPQNVLSLLR